MPDEGLRPFYEEHYADTGDAASESRRWRTLSAVAKARNVSTLLPDLGPSGVRLLDIGCGDGAVLEAIAGDHPEWSFAGVEIAQRAVDIAAGRLPAADIQRYDGTTLPFEDETFDVGVLSHVLEHVTDPPAVLREAARVCRVVHRRGPARGQPLDPARVEARDRREGRPHPAAVARRRQAHRSGGRPEGDARAIGPAVGRGADVLRRVALSAHEGADPVAHADDAPPHLSATR